MTAPTIRALGRDLHALERITVAGELAGLSKATSYRVSPSWPTVGECGRQYVLMVPFLKKHGIPFEVIDQDSDNAASS